MKSTFKNLLHKFLINLVWVLYRALYSTYRFEIKNPEMREKARNTSPNNSFVFAIWHEQSVNCLFVHSWTEPYLALASKSKDGDFAAEISRRSGYVPIRGSSKKNNVDKGGKEALTEFVQYLKKGTSGGITIDGPKGPRRKCKAGIVIMAQRSGSPILPVVTQANSYWEFNSWDRFKLAKPFTKITMMYGEGIFIKPDITESEVNESLKQVDEAMEKLDRALITSM